MKNNNSEIAYRLFCRFDGLVNSIRNMKTDFINGIDIRFKPLFTSYNSCIEAFQQAFPEEYKALNLEPLPLEDEKGNKLFTNKKISTLQHQAEAVLALLKGLSPRKDVAIDLPAKVTIGWLFKLFARLSLGSAIFILSILSFLFLLGLAIGQSKLYFDFKTPQAQFNNQDIPAKKASAPKDNKDNITPAPTTKDAISK